MKIENAEWLLAGGAAAARLVEWEAKPKLTAVVGKAPGKEGEETCRSGVSSGLECGEVLKVGVTEGGTKNLVETSIRGAGGDSGGPEFARIRGGVLIQGTVVGGAGSDFIRGGGDITTGSKMITEYPGGKTACEKIAEFQAKWKVTGVPVEGKGIPAKTIVKECKVAGTSATVEMSAAATETAVNVTIAIGHTALSVYEPMSQIEAVFKGQALLVK